MPRSSCTQPMPDRARLCGGQPVTSLPRNVMSPVTCPCRTITLRTSVVFPAPFRPTRVTTSPAPTWSETSRSACAWPYHALSVEMSSMAGFPQVRGDDAFVVADLVIGALGQNRALLEDGDLVGEAADHMHVVVHEHDGPPVGDAAYQVDRVVDVLNAHSGGRLVEQHHRRVEREYQREFERSLLSVGELAGGSVGERDEPDLFEEAVDVRAVAAQQLLRAPESKAVAGPSLECEFDMLTRGEVVEQAGDLERPGDAL